MAQEMIEIKSSHIKETPYDPFFEMFVSQVVDYVHKATLATIMFFTCWPWAALFWPPYYFMRRARQ
jgi:hypothetical protein